MSMDFIRRLYDSETNFPMEDEYYTNVLENPDFSSISPQAYFLLKQQERLDHLPSFFRGHLKEQFQKTLVQNLLIQKQQKDLLDQFETLGVDVIPLKGTRLAETYFGHVGARATSDIDLLIRKTDLEKAKEAVIDRGFIIEEEMIFSHFHHSFSKRIPGSQFPLTVELHWNILREDTSSFDIETFWEQSVPEGASQHIKELSKAHTFYMICLHGWRHNLQSLKYFLDMIQMIHFLPDDLDFKELIRQATRDKTLKRVIRTLSIVYREFPLLNDVKPFPRKRSHLYWEYPEVHASSKKTFKTYIDYFDYQFLSYDSIRHSMAEVLHWMKTDMISVVRSKSRG